MKILHYSDHLVPNLKELFVQSDLLFTTGDLLLFDFSEIDTLINTKPSFGVYGNHDTPGYLDKLGISNVNLRVVEHQGLRIGGFEGCPRYKEGGGPQFTEEEAELYLKDFLPVDILLLHAAPFGLLDTPGDPVHTGSKVVRQYVDRTKPKFIFCGHDSPNLEIEYNGTKIYRTDGARIITI